METLSLSILIALLHHYCTFLSIFFRECQDTGTGGGGVLHINNLSLWGGDGA